MRAIVCDCCGKVVLLAEDEGYREPENMHRLSGRIIGRSELDLCTECAEKLIQATRGQEAET